jgi:peptide/nickel transport system ATP-binding protein
MVFQEPMASLSPMYTVGNQITEAIRLHLPLSKEEAWQRGLELLAHVGIPRAARTMESYPFQLSGGMCQRVMIAIALSCRPRLLIADEPTTALDVTTQARIIDLLRDLQTETGMAMMFITHDLGVVAEIADEVVVMYLGTVVEQASVDDLFHDPQHPYTKALLRSIPKMGSGTRQALSTIRGQVPHPQNRPTGCPFHTRCDYAMPGLCDVVEPPLVELGPRRVSRCVLHDPALLQAHGVSRSQEKENV